MSKLETIVDHNRVMIIISHHYHYSMLDYNGANKKKFQQNLILIQTNE